MAASKPFVVQRAGGIDDGIVRLNKKTHRFTKTKNGERLKVRKIVEIRDLCDMFGTFPHRGNISSLLSVMPVGAWHLGLAPVFRVISQLVTGTRYPFPAMVFWIGGG